MLTQGIIQIGNSFAFIDHQSDVCIDGKPCDENGDMVWTVDGKRFRERDFKEYRKFSPEFRRYMIMKLFEMGDMTITGESCSCSKCGTVMIDEFIWKY